MAEPNNLPRGEHLDANREKGNKWKVSVEKYSKSPVDKVWAVAGDFCGLEQWVPGGAKVTVLEEFGKRNEPGCIRRCTSTTGGQTSFVDEKLLVQKNEEYFVQYTLLDENWIGKLYGFTDYVATMKFERLEANEGCVLHWSAEMTPTGDKPEEEAIQFFQNLYDVAFKNIDACASAA